MRAMQVPVSFQNGKLASVSSIDKIIQQKIINVIVTSKRERVMRPEYGAGVYNLLWERMDPLVMAEWKAEALQEIAQNVTGAEIVDIEMSNKEQLASPSNASTLSIRVFYRIPPYRVATMEFSIGEFLTEESFL